MAKETLSLKVDSDLKKKVKTEYGTYSVVEDMIIDYMYDTKESERNFNDKIKVYEDSIKVYDECFEVLQKNKQDLISLEQKILERKQHLQGKLQEYYHVKDNIHTMEIKNKELIDYSVDEVIKILKENQKTREETFVERIPKKVINNYANNCHLRFNQFINLIPSDLHECIEL